MEKIARREAVDVSISVVSHLQMDLVAALLADLEAHCKSARFELILTLNLDEALPFALDGFSWPVEVVRNAAPKGFGANHNQAFACAMGQYFCVINPDIRLNSNPFNDLISCLQDSSVAVAAPLVLNELGEIDDTARRFPSPLGILRKVFGRRIDSDYAIGNAPIHPDWVGGMFMVYPHALFGQIGGFDERYFLYYEDVDICARLKLRGYEVALCPQAKAFHYARRSSHRSLKYATWHLTSMIRFFLSPVYWRLRTLSRP